MKGSLSLNTTVHDSMSLLHCEHSLQTQKYFYVPLLCVAFVTFS